MSFQQSINNAMSAGVQIQGAKALQEQAVQQKEQTQIQDRAAREAQQTKDAREALQTAADNLQAQGTKHPESYDKATEYYTDKLMQSDAEPSLVSHEIHELAMKSGNYENWMVAYDYDKGQEAKAAMQAQTAARKQQVAEFNKFLQSVMKNSRGGKK